jgi:hypothetical protein
MKKATLVLLMFSAALYSPELKAQVKVNVSLNVGAQPDWGPDGYYHVEYYYLPDIDAYYYVPKRQFIYFESNRWVFAAALPARSASYNLYRGYKIIINEPRPYIHHNFYHVKYAKYCGKYGYQRSIKEAHLVKVNNDDGPGHGNGRGHAYGHDKHQKKGQR